MSNKVYTSTINADFIFYLFSRTETTIHDTVDAKSPWYVYYAD